MKRKTDACVFRYVNKLAKSILHHKNPKELYNFILLVKQYIVKAFLNFMEHIHCLS